MPCFNIGGGSASWLDPQHYDYPLFQENSYSGVPRVLKTDDLAMGTNNAVTIQYFSAGFMCTGCIIRGNADLNRMLYIGFEIIHDHLI